MSARAGGFYYAGSELHGDGVALRRLANRVGTPAYVYSESILRDRVERLKTALEPSGCKIYFAVKACSNQHILSLLGKLGCGADIVSGGELFRARKAGISQTKIVFSGVGKSRNEIEQAAREGIHTFNVESVAELAAINEVGHKLRRKLPVSLRVNPDVDAKTHPYISTGLKENKFGLDQGEIKHIVAAHRSLKYVNFQGLSCHIGSQILDLSPLTESWRYLVDLADDLPFKITHLDLGGGLGIRYVGKEREPSLEDYGSEICKFFQKTAKRRRFQLGIEPGRSLVGPAAVLLTKVIAVKERGPRTFCVLDAGMNDLIRPALYQATHPVIPVTRPAPRAKLQTITLVGPVCESADTFQEKAKLAALAENDLVTFGNAGAYGMTMASQYNSRPRPPEVLVAAGKATIIRERETYSDLIAHEKRKKKVKL